MTKVLLTFLTLTLPVGVAVPVLPEVPVHSSEVSPQGESWICTLWPNLPVCKKN